MKMLMPTLKGFRNVFEIKSGDDIFAANGAPVTVIGVEDFVDYAFLIRTDDGFVIPVSKSQEICVRLDRKAKKFSVRRVSELYLRQLRGMRSPMLRVSSPIYFQHSPQLIHPYILGYWLGNGSKQGGFLTVHGKDVEWVLEKIKRLGYSGYITRDYRPKGRNCCMVTIVGLTSLLRQLGVLNNKHIPESCFHADIEHRIALLNGLMDSDGYVSKQRKPLKDDYVHDDVIVIKRGTPVFGGQCEFCTTKSDIADQTRRLIVSLGVKVSRYDGMAKLYEKVCGEKFRLLFYYAKACSSPRKSISQYEPKKRARYITISASDRPVQMRRFRVDYSRLPYLFNSEQQYLAGEGCVALFSEN